MNSVTISNVTARNNILAEAVERLGLFPIPTHIRHDPAQCCGTMDVKCA